MTSLTISTPTSLTSLSLVAIFRHLLLIVFVSQLVRYAMTCSKFSNFIIRARRRAGKLFIRACPRENLPNGNLPTVMLFAFTVMSFTRIVILRYFENEIGFVRKVYYYCMRHYFTIKIFFQLSDTKFCAILKMFNLILGRFSHGCAHIGIFYIKHGIVSEGVFRSLQYSHEILWGSSFQNNRRHSG